MKVEKILFIGLSSVGDVVMTSPIIQILHNKFPEAIIDFVGDKRSKGLYDHIPFLGTLYFKDKNRFLRGAPHLIRQLWKNHYDIIVDVRTDGIAYLLRGRKRYTKWKARSYGVHAVEDLLGVIADLHKQDPIPHTRVWLSAPERDYAKKLTSVFSNKDNILSISVGDPNNYIKNSTIDKIVSLLDQHKDEFSGIIFLGGNFEYENTTKVISRLDINHIVATGNSLLEAAALLEISCLYIGPDSGLGHIASAVKTPTISLFSQVSPKRYRPWGDSAICLRGEGDDARNISVKEMSDAVKSMIDV